MFERIKKKVLFNVALILALYGIFAISNSSIANSISNVKNVIINNKLFSLGEAGIYLSTLILPAASGILHGIIALLKKKGTIGFYAIDIITWILCNGAGVGIGTIFKNIGFDMAHFSEVAAVVSNLDIPEFLKSITSIDANLLTPALITTLPIITSLGTKIVGTLIKAK